MAQGDLTRGQQTQCGPDGGVASDPHVGDPGLREAEQRIHERLQCCGDDAVRIGHKFGQLVLELAAPAGDREAHRRLQSASTTADVDRYAAALDAGWLVVDQAGDDTVVAAAGAGAFALAGGAAAVAAHPPFGPG
jgi:hypothetical protein